MNETKIVTWLINFLSFLRDVPLRTGQSWEEIISAYQIEEGDLAMLIFRTADNLRHIKALVEIFPLAALTSGQSIELIMRGPVVMDYDL